MMLRSYRHHLSDSPDPTWVLYVVLLGRTQYLEPTMCAAATTHGIYISITIYGIYLPRKQ